MMTHHASNISLRPVGPDDLEFLLTVYASTRVEELALVPWTDAEKTAFIQMQFNAQHHHYQKYYADASFLVILRDGHPVGRLYVGRWEKEIRIVDIALLPEHRGAGIGGALLQDLLTEAAGVGKKVSIHVEHNNPAMRLYERLGFRKQEDVGVYFRMEWSPP